MPLFQKSVVNKYLNNLNPVNVEEAYKQFIQFYGDAERIENIKRKIIRRVFYVRFLLM